MCSKGTRGRVSIDTSDRHMVDTRPTRVDSRSSGNRLMCRPVAFLSRRPVGRESTGKLRPASWNFEVGPAIIKKKKAESYNDV